MADDITDDVQPDAGQGAGGTTDAPYAEYLNRIPEQLRGDVEPVFKDWDANVTRRFQEHSEFRKSWEPYQDTGISQYTPEEVQWLAQFRPLLDDPQATQQWFNTYAEQNGLTPQEAQQQVEDSGLEDYQDPTAAALRQELQQSLSPITQELNEFKQWREQQQTATREQEALAQINSQLAEIEKKHPDEFNKDMVERFVSQYIQTDPQNAVRRAFADWQQIRNSIQKETLQSKVSQPATPESGGYYDGTAAPLKTMADAKAVALEMLRGTNRQ
jgi:hypothetical protein